MAYLFDSKSNEPYKISRTKIDLFLECPHCFYLDRVLGISRPSGPGFSLNSAVDHLLKKEFDIYREKKEPHPLMLDSKIDAVPFIHADLDEWRENFKGVQVLHKHTNLLITGAIDDVWVTPSEELFVVDYKATSTEKEISLEDQYKQGYKRQMEVYQWLMRGKGFKVSNTGYFVFCNGIKDRDLFDKKLEFDLSIISYEGKSDWIEPVLKDIKDTLMKVETPAHSQTCEYGKYLKKAVDLE